MQEHQTNKATLQTFQPTYPYYRRPFSLTTIIWVPLGRLVPLGRFGASWNIPLTVGDILYTPAGRNMRDERLPVIYTPLFFKYSDKLEVVCRILYGADRDILLYSILYARSSLAVASFYRRLIRYLNISSRRFCLQFLFAQSVPFFGPPCGI